MRYQKSVEYFQRAKERIPLASQTFSKSVTQYPLGAAPLAMTRAKGCRTWDVDGNEYIDMVCALLSVTLGHGDEDVISAVERQLRDGTSFSLPHPLEDEVAELIVDTMPCAEMVRFGKNGSDATSGAIRLARAYTGRDHVAVCGYHGWQDWYIGSTARNLGVPKAVQALTHTFKYNDLQSLIQLFEQHPGQLAAVILEPMNVAEPAPGFLQGIRDLCTKNGTLLIFDEVITGYRFSLGGAQELFGVTPDLASIGKGMANGFPIAAVVGKKEYMRLMEEIFFSTTFGGDTIALAAAAATIRKLESHRVPDVLRERGGWLKGQIQGLIKKHQLEDAVGTAGQPCWSFVTFKDTPKFDQWTLRTYFLTEMYERGVLTIGTNNMCFAHRQKDLEQVASAYADVFSMMSKHLNAGDLDRQLRCPPLKPLFRVR